MRTRPNRRLFVLHPLLLLLLTALLASACVDRLNKPPPPDTTELQSAVAAPTGIVMETPVAMIFDALSEGGVVESLCGFDPIAEADCGLTDSCPPCLATDALSAGFTALIPELTGEDPDSTLDGLSGVSGVLLVDRVCSGFSVPLPDPAHGVVSLTVGFTGRGLDPVVFGEVIECQGELAGLDITIDGDLVLVYEERVPFDQIASTPVLFGFDGRVDYLGSSHELTLGYYFRPDGQGARGFLLEVAGHGSFVFILSPLGLQLRGADGLFSCNAITETCAVVQP